MSNNLNDVSTVLNKNSLDIPQINDSQYENSDLLVSISSLTGQIAILSGLCMKPDYFSTPLTSVIKGSGLSNRDSAYTVQNTGYVLINAQTSHTIYMQITGNRFVKQ